jgi:predicted nucleic acid-binding protein
LEEAAVLHADAYLACLAREEDIENVYTFDKKTSRKFRGSVGFREVD